MDFFDMLGKTLVSAGKDVAEKTKEITDVAKVKLDIKVKEDYIQRLYAEIGKSYFEQHQFDEHTEFSQIRFIKETMDEIDALKADLMDIKGTKKCSQCETQLPLDAEFCTKCGARQIVDSPEDERFEEEQENVDPVQFEEKEKEER